MPFFSCRPHAGDNPAGVVNKILTGAMIQQPETFSQETDTAASVSRCQPSENTYTVGTREAVHHEVRI